jgi:hypothetical protein
MHHLACDGNELSPECSALREARAAAAAKAAEKDKAKQ